MFISKKKLSRRTLLKGVLPLPFLSAMAPALTAEVLEPLRFGSVYLPNGIYPQFWHASGTEKDWQMGRTMSPMQPHKDYVTTIRGLEHTPGGKDNGGIHAGASISFLNGTGPVGAGELRSVKSIDQYIADRIAGDTPITSLELGTEDMASSAGQCDGFPCGLFNSISWKDETTPLQVAVNPQVTFERLFGDPGTPAQRLHRMKTKGSMLDSVLQELNSFQATIGAEDNHIMNSFTTSVREVEIMINKMLDKNIDIDAEAPVGAPEAVDEHVSISYELMRLALVTDLTRVLSFMVAHEASGQSYGFLGLQSTYHSTSHHGNVPELLEDYVKISTYHVAKFANFIDQLKNTPTAHGNLLDASYFYFGAGISNGNAHDRRNVPAMIVGKANGRLEGNKAIYLEPDKGWVPTSNLLLALGDIAGVELDSIGRSTGRLSL